MIKSICIIILTGLLTISQYALAQNGKSSIEKADSVMLQMREAESRYIALIDYYHIRTSKNGRKKKIKGFNDDISNFKISKEKIIVSRKGSKFRQVFYYKRFVSDPSMSTNLFSHLKVFRKTEINEKLVSAKFYLPNNRAQYVLDGKYFQLDNQIFKSPGIKYKKIL